MSDRRRRIEPSEQGGEAVHEVLGQISRSQPLAEILHAITRHARDLVKGEGAGIRLHPSLSGFVGPVSDACTESGLVCAIVEARHGTRRDSCPVRTPHAYRHYRTVALVDEGGSVGELWVGRRSDGPFSRAEQTFLETLGGLAVLAVKHAQMIDAERLSAVVDERVRIARELHDSLAQVLGVTHLRLRALSGLLDSTPTDAVRTELDALADLCQESYRDVREAILGLRDSNRADRSLLENLEAYVAAFGRSSGIEARLDADQRWDPPLAPTAEVQVLRIVQEALTNVRKHAAARRAVVTVDVHDDETTFAISDDGRGFDPDGLPPEKQGFGLHTMRERSEQARGRLSIESAPGRGTRVTVTLPHRRAADGTTAEDAA